MKQLICFATENILVQNIHNHLSKFLKVNVEVRISFEKY